MSLMAMYRRWQFRAIDRNLLTLTHIVETISDDGAFNKRDGGDGWTISEVLGHLGDFESYMLARARYICGETSDEPPQPAGPEALVIEMGYAEQDASELLARWQARRRESTAFFNGLDNDDDALWERGAPFAGGPFTLNNQLILTPMHDDDHMNQIVKIIRS